jgi:hypothetical protein
MVGKNEIPIFGLNAIGDDSYFVRLKGSDAFLHPDSSLETEDEIGYRIIEGCKGAAIFHKQQAENIITVSGSDDLEPVKVKNILGNDNSLN